MKRKTAIRLFLNNLPSGNAFFIYIYIYFLFSKFCIFKLFIFKCPLMWFSSQGTLQLVLNLGLKVLIYLPKDFVLQI